MASRLSRFTISPNCAAMMRTSPVRWAVVGAALSLACSQAIQAEVRPVIDERVYVGLAGPSDSVAVWVFLREKEPLGDRQSRAIPQESWLSTRARNRRVRQELPEVTEEDRPVSADAVAALRDCGLAVRTVSRWLTAVSGWADGASAEKLAHVPWVDSIRVVRTYRRNVRPAEDEPKVWRPGDQSDTVVLDYGPSLAQVAQIGIADAHLVGYSGEGIYIGVLDTGFNPAHEAFDSTRLLVTRDFINGDDDVADNDPEQMDHGTKTWSVCGAYVPGQLIGGAFRADFALAKTEIAQKEYIEEEDYYVAGLEWFDSLGVDVVSSSLGYPDFYDYGDLNGRTAITTKAVNRAATRGMLVVTAAGNRGNDKDDPWVYPPGDADSALTVGAVYADGTRIGFSSVGPTADGRIKPDVMAMGSGVAVADDEEEQYVFASGTSFSTPLAACAVALLLEKYPGMLPMEVIARLRETGSQAAAPDNFMGYGIVNLAGAMDLDVPAGPQIVAVPNPFTDSVQFQFPAGIRPIRLLVFTSAGSLVFSEDIAGRRAYAWKGGNEAGEKVASGVYLCWFATSAGEYTVKVAYFRRE